MRIRLITASVIVVLWAVPTTPAAMAATSAPASGGALVVQGAVLGVTGQITSSSAYKYGAGVEMSGPIGIDLPAHPGYSTSAALGFTLSQARYLRGTHAKPGNTPKRLVAGQG
jgi:hypothetical protein